MALIYKNVDIKRPQEQSVKTSLMARLHSAVDQKDLSKGNSQLSKSKQDVINQEGNNKIHHKPDDKSLSSLKHDPTLNSTVLALQRLKAANKFGTISSASSSTKPANVGSKSNQNYLQPNSKSIQKGTKKHSNYDSLSSKVHFREDNANRFEEQVVDNSLYKLVNIPDNCLHYTWKLETHKRSVRKDHIVNHITSKMSELQSTGTSSSMTSSAPPPPPPGPPPPPPPALPLTINMASNQDGRSALLSSIQKGTKLKPTKTKDCSSPLVGGSSKTVSVTGSSGSSSSALKSFTVDKNDDHLNVLEQALKARAMKSGDTTSQRKEDRKFSLAEGVKTPNTAKETRSKSTWIAPNITRNGVTVESERDENEGNKFVNSTSQSSSEISHNINDHEKGVIFKNRKGSMTSTEPCQKQSDEITHLNDQEGNSIDASADKNLFCEVKVQDKATFSAVAQQSKELMPVDSDITERKKKVSVDILRTIEDGPNLKPKETTSRNFGERMAALQKEGKLVTRKEHEETMLKGENKKEFTEDKKQPQPNTSWKSEYSVSNEGSKSAGDMFGLSTSQQHRAKPGTLPNVTVVGSLTSLNMSKNVSSTLQGAEKNYESSASISRNSGNSNPMSAQKVRNGPKPPSSKVPNQSKINPDDVKICSCVETTSFDGANKCSHSSDPSAIHLDMDKVMKFLGDVKK